MQGTPGGTRKKRQEDGEVNAVYSFSEWLEWAEPIAYGPLNLLPETFGKLQPHEFEKLWDGYQWRKKQRETEAAYWVHRIAVHLVKKPMTPEELLRPLRQEEAKQNRVADEQYLRETFKNRLPGGE
jgi:hypothetical protein